ncbi:uncharacterized protein LOC131996798 [Stomoxys calcitrans]|uniref:uncharacterized protein LOC131996798 n=1 Tax=Stomoxys calcitrans TaxID=35570 RepID=UPI0027E234FF|nr:uncharacterized protein LOC131996798 [Stomoxys calcitrans]
MPLKHIKKLKRLSPQERTDFLNSFDLILSDCDGVVWMASGIPIAGAGETVNLLKAYGKEVKFVTNNSLRSDVEYVEKFTKLGVKNVEENDIVYPTKAMAWYLKKIKPAATIYPLIASASKKLLSSYGFNLIPIDIDVNELTFQTFAHYLTKNGPTKVDTVIIDYNLATGYAHIIKALQYLNDPECKLMVGATDSMVPLTSSLSIPGYLDFYEILTKYTSKEPIVMGKPSKHLEDFLKEFYTITNSKRCLFIGDSLKADIGFGKSAGFQTLFVSTGINNEEDVLNAPEMCTPDYYADSFADLKELVLEQGKLESKDALGNGNGIKNL